MVGPIIPEALMSTGTAVLKILLSYATAKTLDAAKRQWFDPIFRNRQIQGAFARALDCAIPKFRVVSLSLRDGMA